MPRESARRVAQLALARWRTGREFADTIAQASLSNSALIGPDRAFALELFYGVLRNLTLLDFWIGRLRDAPLEPALRDVVRLGLFQLLLLETREHAAVFETVELVANRQRAVVNGVLRAAVRQRADLRARAAAQPLHVRASHPEFLVEKWRRELGETTAEKLCAWNNQTPPLYVRINSQTSTDEGVAIPDAELLVEHAGFLRVRSLPFDALARGDAYVQDPSTALAPQLLGSESGETILDSCAAPGGKTGIIAQQTRNKAHITATDRDESRLEILRSNLKRLGANADILLHDWTRQPELKPSPRFDRILVDAPCSNTGVMRRRVDVRWRLTPDDLKRMPELQFALVLHTSAVLKPGGALVYSTCSIEAEENERVVERIQREIPGLRLEKIRAVTPWNDRIDGAFAARFVRIDGVQTFDPR